jgi:hypothetical protein
MSSRYNRRSPGINNLAEDGIPDPGLQGIGDDEVRPSSKEILNVELEVHKVCDWLQGRSLSTARLRVSKVSSPSRNSTRMSMSLAGVSSFCITDPEMPMRATP